MSSWLDEVARPAHMEHTIFHKKLGMKDLTEISMADLLILETLEDSKTGGKEVEFGYALGKFQAKEVWIVGPLRNVFHPLADRFFATWEECLAYLGSIK